MTRAQPRLALCLLMIGLAGCSAMPGGGSGIVSRSEALAREGAAPEAETLAPELTSPDAPAPTAPITTTSAPVLQPEGATVAQLDTTTAAEKAAAAAPPAQAGGKLGTTIASLGDASEAGFWIKTPLVTAPGEGRVVYPANGKSANVTLKPLSGGGSGSQISLAVMQTLGVSLTDLPELEVWKN